MNITIENLKRLLMTRLPQCQVEVDEPEHAGGNFWIDVVMGKKRHTLEYRPGKGFGLFHEGAGYGEGPTEIYRTPERVAQRLAQLMAAKKGKTIRLGLKESAGVVWAIPGRAGKKGRREAAIDIPL